MTEERADALARLIEKHLPGSARELGWRDMETGDEPSTLDWGPTDAGSSPPLEAQDESDSFLFSRTQVHIAAGSEIGTKINRYSQSHARLLLWASIQGEGWFHASFDAELLGRLTRALREAQMVIQDLSPSVQSRLSWALALYNNSKSGGATMDNSKAADVIRRLQRATQLAADDVSARPRPGRGRNWRAAAVADACRTVWAYEKWVEEERGRFKTAMWEDVAGSGGVPQSMWDEYLETSAPSYAKDGDPGPFGKLLEDVIAALEIVGRDGEPVSAASALRARKQGRAQLEQKNEILLTRLRAFAHMVDPQQFVGAHLLQHQFRGVHRMADIYLSDTQLASRYGVHRSTPWRWVKTDPNFPKPVALTKGCTRWKLAELEAWELQKANNEAA